MREGRREGGKGEREGGREGRGGGREGGREGEREEVRAPFTEYTDDQLMHLECHPYDSICTCDNHMTLPVSGLT